MFNMKGNYEFVGKVATYPFRFCVKAASGLSCIINTLIVNRCCV